MSYNAFTDAQIAAGEANKQELWLKTKENFDDHEERILNLEATALASAAIVFEVLGSSSASAALTEADFERVRANYTLTSGRIYVPKVGSSGTVQVDVKRKPFGGGSWTTIFTTKPSVAVGAGDGAVSTNGALSQTTLEAGDQLRLDIDSVQIGCAKFVVELTVEASAS